MERILIIGIAMTSGTIGFCVAALFSVRAINNAVFKAEEARETCSILYNAVNSYVASKTPTRELFLLRTMMEVNEVMNFEKRREVK